MADKVRHALRAAANIVYATVDAISVEDEGIVCDLTLDSEEPAVGRLLLGFGGNDHGDYTTPEVGQQVLCLLLNGDPNECVIIGRLNTTQQPPPAGVSASTHVYRGRDGQDYDGLTRGDFRRKATGTMRHEGAPVEMAGTDDALDAADGVVTGKCICMWGGIHGDVSAVVRAQKEPPIIGHG